MWSLKKFFFSQTQLNLHNKSLVNPPQVAVVGQGGVTGFFSQYRILLKYACLVFYVENGQIEYILIIFSFTNIVWIVASIDW